jgi:RimJ/RimL family protein N-acetyltransferase
VSYWSNTSDRGRGYISRERALLAEYARAAGLARLESHVAADDVPSCRVSERAGFVREESFNGEASEQ